MFFEIMSDRPVIIDGIGKLDSNKPVILDEEMLHAFKIHHNRSLLEAKFPYYIEITAVVN